MLTNSLPHNMHQLIEQVLASRFSDKEMSCRPRVPLLMPQKLKHGESHNPMLRQKHAARLQQDSSAFPAMGGIVSDEEYGGTQHDIKRET